MLIHCVHYFFSITSCLRREFIAELGHVVKLVHRLIRITMDLGVVTIHTDMPAAWSRLSDHVAYVEAV